MTKENETESEEHTLSKELAEIEEIFPEISPEKKEKLKELLTIDQKLSFKGPLPPPAILKAYKDINPAYPEMIFSAFE